MCHWFVLRTDTLLQLPSNSEVKSFTTRDEQEVAGCAYVPFSSLESVVEQSKEAYHLALRQTQGTIRTESPDWQPWLEYFLRSLAERAHRLEKKVEREKIVLATVPALQLQVVEFAGKLVEHGLLSQHGSGRGVWYDLR